MTGVYILHYELLVDWGKNMLISSEKNANIRGEEVEKWGKRRKISTVPRGKISFWKEGKGQIYPILGKYTPL